jgi:2-dehydropantoate 2-reductase
VLGPCDARLAETFSEAVATEVSADIAQALWRKLIVNCAYNAISAISQSSYGRMMGVRGVVGLMGDIVAEGVAVAARRGVRLPADFSDSVLAIAKTMPNQSSSMAQDLAYGRKTEIERLNGYIVEAGEACGVETPINRTLLCLVRLLEAAKD